MKWLVLFWTISTGFVPDGYDRIHLNQEAEYQVSVPEEALYVDIGVKAELFNVLKIWGNTEGYITPLEGFSFNPYRQDYGIGMAVYYGPFEFGIKHECDHGVRSTKFSDWYEKGETQVYLMFSGKTEL